jgi:hypothetical protein
MFASCYFFLLFLLRNYFQRAQQNGSADFDDLYVERRGLMQEVAFEDPNAFEGFQRVYFR